MTGRCSRGSRPGWPTGWTAGLERPEFTRLTLDGALDSGKYSSVTVGSDGFPFVTYWDVSSVDLKADATSVPFSKRNDVPGPLNANLRCEGRAD